MKKILSVLSIVTAAVMVTVCVSCKKNDDGNVTRYDFTNMSLELLESCLGKDSATIVNAIKEQGFVINKENFYFQDCYDIYYENKSYGIGYGMELKDGVIITMSGVIPDNKDNKKYYEFGNKVRDKKLPLFYGVFADPSWENKECTDNISDFFEKENKKDCASYTYANEKKYYEISRIIDPSYSYFPKGIQIYVGKSDPDDPFNSYNYAKYGCGYDPWK